MAPNPVGKNPLLTCVARHRCTRIVSNTYALFQVFCKSDIKTRGEIWRFGGVLEGIKRNKGAYGAKHTRIGLKQYSYEFLAEGWGWESPKTARNGRKPSEKGRFSHSDGKDGGTGAHRGKNK